MTTAQQIALALIIFAGASIALVLLWGKFVNVGRGETRYAPDHIEALNNLALERNKLAMECYAERQYLIARCRTELDALAAFPGTPEVIALRTLLHVQIDELQGQRGETMATLTEGRM